MDDKKKSYNSYVFEMCSYEADEYKNSKYCLEDGHKACI